MEDKKKYAKEKKPGSEVNQRNVTPDKLSQKINSNIGCYDLTLEKINEKKCKVATFSTLPEGES